MNIVNYEFVRTYLLSKFKDYSISSSSEEFVIPSIFVDNDYKRHMSINMYSGLWRCFKTGNAGNFIKLYSILEKCSYKTAYENVVFENFMAEDKEVPKELSVKTLTDTSVFTAFDTYGSYPDGSLEKAACDYLSDRKLSFWKFYLCKEGFYKNRLIIPYFNEKDEMFYFQARALLGQEPKYLNCKDFKIGSILFPYDYDLLDPLYVTEGALDSITLKCLGLNSTTTLSCVVSDAQMEQLKFYRGPIVVAYDNDDAGRKGAYKFLQTAYKAKMDNIWMATPNEKDWNDEYTKNGMNEVFQLAKNVQKIDPLALLLRNLK